MAPKAHIPLVRLARLGRVEKVLVPVHEVLHVLVDSGPRRGTSWNQCSSGSSAVCMGHMGHCHFANIAKRCQAFSDDNPMREYRPAEVDPVVLQRTDIFPVKVCQSSSMS